MVWNLTACQNKTVNVLVAPTDLIARRMMDTFERAGYHWVNTVSEETEMGYRLDRVKEGE